MKKLSLLVLLTLSGCYYEPDLIAQEMSRDCVNHSGLVIHASVKVDEVTVVCQPHRDHKKDYVD